MSHLSKDAGGGGDDPRHKMSAISDSHSLTAVTGDERSPHRQHLHLCVCEEPHHRRLSCHAYDESGPTVQSPSGSFDAVDGLQSQWSESDEEPRPRSTSLSSLSEKLRFKRLFGSKRQRKRDKPARSSGNRSHATDILDKKETGKLTKFWWGVETPEASPDISLPFAVRKTSAPDAMSQSLAPPNDVPGGSKKREAIQDAKDTYDWLRRSCEKNKVEIPPFDFYELIGKGASGRVYKCRDQKTGNLVAIKIVNTDDVDYAADHLDKDITIRDFRKEVTVLQQLKDSRAKNVNMIHDAFDMQEHLWIVSDYCTGGSVRTLMRAQPASQPGLDEMFIIPIARELAIALKSVHDIGVIHRDIKCTNVYVSETGDIQLGDFGIVGVMDDGASKRKTILGTPHYMPLELHMHMNTPGNQTSEGYGTEIDIWSYGCSIYEMATGLPPNAYKGLDQLPTALRTAAPRLEGGSHSQELRDFVAFCLNSNPKERPTADEVLKHPYIADTEQRYPNSSLVKLIERYMMWEHGGGVRASLFFPGGAPPVSSPSTVDTTATEADFDDWNFSTSENFGLAFERRYSQMILGQEPDDPSIQAPATFGLPPLVTKNLTPLEQIQNQHREMSASRGERSLDRLFNAESAPYELHTPLDQPEPPVSDLPFRDSAGAAPIRESTLMIDLDSAGALDLDQATPNFNFDFGDIPTLKAKSARQPPRQDEEEEEDTFTFGRSEDDNDKRATMDWTFPSTKRATMDWTFPSREPAEPGLPAIDTSLSHLPDGGPVRPALKHTQTMPLGQMGDHIHPSTLPLRAPSPTPIRESVRSMIDLDLSLASDPVELERPSTSHSASESVMTDILSRNPFDLEEVAEQSELDRDRFSDHHTRWSGSGGQQVVAHPSQRSRNGSLRLHTRGSSISSRSEDDAFGFEYPSEQDLPALGARPQLGANMDTDAIDLNSWPNFDSAPAYERAALERSPGWHDRLDDHAIQHVPGGPIETFNGNSRAPGTTIFPSFAPPQPEALAEDSEPRVVAAELDRLLGGLGEAMKLTAKAIKVHTGVSEGEGYETLSETEGSGFSSAVVSGDEERAFSSR